MKKRLLAMLMVIALAVSLLPPVTAAAAANYREDYADVIAAANAMTFPTDKTEKTAVCPACGENATWVALSQPDAGHITMTSGHYYLAEDISLTNDTGEAYGYYIGSGVKVCLHRNGKDIVSLGNHTQGQRCYSSIRVAGGSLNLMGEGLVSGSAYNWGALDASGTVEVFGGSIYNNTGNRRAVIGKGGVTNLYDVTIQKGWVYVTGGVVNVQSGTYEGVWTDSSNAITNINGGTIGSVNNSASTVTMAGTLNINGGNITTLHVRDTLGTTTISGAPVIGNVKAIADSYKMLTVGTLTAGASINLGSKTGVFTTPFESEAAAKAAIPYFTAGDSIFVNKENCLAAGASSYLVGYSKVDINPYADGSGEDQTLMNLPMAGYGDNATRLSQSTKLDDNGDGIVDENDGIFATCTAITDSAGNTVLLYTLDLLWGANGNYTSQVLDALLNSEEFKQYNLTEDKIFFNGSHNHFATSMSNGEEGDVGIYNAYLRSQLIDAARQALADRAWADMYQGDMDVVDYFREGDNKNQAAGDLLNDMQVSGTDVVTEKTYTDLVGDKDVYFTCVRHFKITEQKALLNENGGTIADPESGHTWKVDPDAEPVTYYAGNGFNGDWKGVGFRHYVYEYDEATGQVTDKIKEIRVITAWEEATPTDDTLRVLQFRFSSDSGKEPVVLVNWHGHLPSNSELTENSYSTVSGGMPNALRNALAHNGYRASFVQGQTGNVNMTNKSTETIWAERFGAQRVNLFGTELAQLAMVVLEDAEKINADGGEIKALRQVYQTDYQHSTLHEYIAACRYLTEYTNNNKENIGLRIYTNIFYHVDAEGTPLVSGSTVLTDKDGNVLTDGEGNPLTDKVPVGDAIYSALPIRISSVDEANRLNTHYKHKDSVGDYYNDIVLHALTIGDDFKLVSAAAEIFDNYGYNPETGLSLWDKLAGEHNEPFVLGVTNGPGGGYMPDINTYTYAPSDGEPTYVIGTYESCGTRYAVGTGEAMMEQFDIMLDFLENDHPAVETEEAKCQHCGEEAAWGDLTQVVADSRLPIERTFQTGHYYLSGETDLVGITVPTGATVCIDLKGQNLNIYRTLYIQDGGKLTILDSTGGANVTGYDAMREGGLFQINNGGELNIYGGTYRYDENSRRTACGGIVHVAGEFTLYGGDLIGTGVTLMGGTVYVAGNGHAYFRGGSITNGYITSGQPNGRGITAVGQVTLSGDPVIEHLFFILSESNYATQRLHIDGEFTGNVSVGGVRKDVDEPVGDALNGADFTRGTIAFDYNRRPQIVDGKIYIRTVTDYAAYNSQTKAYTYGSYADLNTTLAGLPDGSRVVMYVNTTKAFTVSSNITWELRGRTLNSVITVAQGKSVAFTSCFGTGKVNLAKVNGTVERAQNPQDKNAVYIPITDADGWSTFHEARLNIDQLVLRADNKDETGKASPGLFFNHRFDADTTIKSMVESYGIAFSLMGVPTQEDLLAEGTLVYEDSVVYRSGNVVYTKLDGATFGQANTNTSTLITGVMKEENGTSINARNAQMPIYGVAYVKLTNGQVVFGAARERSFQEQLEGIDTKWDELTDTQRKGVLKMYKLPTVKSVVEKWNVPNLKNPAKVQKPGGEEEKIFRVLSIGNSHTDNATEYLYDIFQAENPDKQVMVAQLYYSGCSVSQHISFAAQDAAVYKYRTQDNRYPSNYSTLRQALNAEVWDVIILHEMNNSAASAGNYTGNNRRNLQKHINYIKENCLNSDPTFIWNFSWANPTSQALWDLGYPADLAYNTYNWVENYKEAYGPEISVMYGNMLQAMINNTKKYIATNSDIDGIAPTGLAFQYARNDQRNPYQDDPDLLLYNDYTHAGPGFGRLLAGYVWYATLMGKTQLTELNYTRDLTEAEQKLLLDAVNYALANVNTLK